jgi:hypothetical protein
VAKKAETLAKRMPGAAALTVVAGGETGEAQRVPIPGRWGSDPRRFRREPAGLIVSRAAWSRTPRPAVSRADSISPRDRLGAGQREGDPNGTTVAIGCTMPVVMTLTGRPNVCAQLN